MPTEPADLLDVKQPILSLALIRDFGKWSAPDGRPPALRNPFEKRRSAEGLSKILWPDGRNRERILLLTGPKPEGTQAHTQDGPQPVRYSPFHHSDLRLAGGRR